MTEQWTLLDCLIARTQSGELGWLEGFDRDVYATINEPLSFLDQPVNVEVILEPSSTGGWSPIVLVTRQASCSAGSYTQELLRIQSGNIGDLVTAIHQSLSKEFRDCLLALAPDAQPEASEEVGEQVNKELISQLVNMKSVED